MALHLCYTLNMSFKWAIVKVGIIFGHCVALHICNALTHTIRQFCNIESSILPSNPFPNKIGKLSRFYTFIVCSIFFGWYFFICLLFHSIICGRGSKQILSGKKKNWKDLSINWFISSFFFSIGKFAKDLFANLLLLDRL